MSNTHLNPHTPAPNEPIANLPEPPAGTRWVYRGRGWDNNGKPCPNGYAFLADGPRGVVNVSRAGSMTLGSHYFHYWEPVAITASTPLEKLDAYFETQEFQDFLNLADEALDGEPLLICKGKPARSPSEAADEDVGEPSFGEKWAEVMNAAKRLGEAAERPEIEEEVIEIIRSRRDIGRAKYGTTMEREDLGKGDWLKHLQEELLDASIYVEKLKRDTDDELSQAYDTIKELRDELDRSDDRADYIVQRQNDTIEELRAEREDWDGILGWKSQEIEELRAERDELLEWKRQEIECASKLDLQAIGQALGLSLGADIAASILPEIKRLKELERMGDAERVKEIQRLVSAFRP